MPNTTALYDHRNWTAYLRGFQGSFKYLDPELTDPDRFPKGRNFQLCWPMNSVLFLDRRDGNGFWVPFKVYAVWGQFCCPVDDSCIWESKEIQVDVLVRELLLTTDCPLPSHENYYFSVSLQFRDQDRRGED